MTREHHYGEPERLGSSNRGVLGDSINAIQTCLVASPVAIVFLCLVAVISVAIGFLSLSASVKEQSMYAPMLVQPCKCIYPC